MRCNIVIVGGGLGLSVTHFAVGIKRHRIHTITICILFVTIYMTTSTEKREK